MANTNPDWLIRAILVDEGPTRALFPYPLFRNILSPSDCRTAVLNETAAFEQEFGASVVQPFYELLWRFNTITDVFSSHATVSPPDRPSPFEWAKAFIGSATILLPRYQDSRHDVQTAEGMANMLTRLLADSKFCPNDTTGWRIFKYTRPP
jgi:hypothetical protein